MRHVFSPTPPELAEDPELAVLTALVQILELVRAALLAQYPDLENDDVEIRRTHTQQDAYASSIFHQLHSLSSVVDEYIGSVRRLRELPLESTGSDERRDLPF